MRADTPRTRPRASPQRRAASVARSGAWGEWGEALVVVLLSRVVFLTAAFVAGGFLSDLPGPVWGGSVEPLTSMWNRWDAAHYVEIARDGYGPAWWNAAYFPLLPLAIRVLARVGIEPVKAGMVVAALSSAVAFVYLRRLGDDEVGEGGGSRAVLYLAFFPTAVFLVAPYAEPVFLAGAVPAFHYARRGRWRAVGLPAAVAMGSRLTGVALLLGLLLEGLRQRLPLRERLEHLGALAVGALPLAAYAGFLWRRKGDPLLFVGAQRAWHRHPTDPVTSFRLSWQSFQQPQPTPFLFSWGGELCALFLATVVVGVFLWRRDWGYAGFTGATLLAYAAVGPYQGVPRMLVTLFPAVLLLAEATRSRRWHELVLLALAATAVVGVVVYTQGVWLS